MRQGTATALPLLMWLLLQEFLQKDDDNVTLEAMMKCDVMAVLCCPLVHDAVPGIHSNALKCLGKLADDQPVLSDALMQSGVLDRCVGHCIKSATVAAMFTTRSNMLPAVKVMCFF